MDRFDEMRGKQGTGGGGMVIIPPEAGALTGIQIAQLPYRTNYIVGDELEIAGLKVIATSENNIDVDVTEGCTIIVNTPLTIDDTIITIKYETFETAFYITIYPKALDIPNNTKVLMHLENNLINEITGGVVNSSNASYATGKYGIGGVVIGTVGSSSLPTWAELRAGTKSATFEFWLKYIRTSDYSGGSNWIYYPSGDLYLKITSATNIQVFGVGEGGTVNVTIPNLNNREWFHFALVYDMGMVRIYVNGIKKAEGKATAKSSDTTTGINFSYYGSTSFCFDEVLMADTALYASNFNVPVIKYGVVLSLQRIYFEKKPNKTTYAIGEKFSLDGAVIKAEFNDGITTVVTSECVIENDTPITQNDDFRKITYTYDGVTKELYVTIGVYTIETTLNLSETKLLMSFDGHTVDATGLNTPTIIGNDLYGEGKFGQARYFNGSTDYISMPNNIDISTGDFTVAFWAKFSGNITNAGVMVSAMKFLSSSTRYGWRIVNNNNMKISCQISTQAGNETIVASLVTTNSVSSNNWFHIAMIRKDNTINLYMDGKLVGSSQFEGEVPNGENVTIGAWLDSSNAIAYPYIGYIDDLIIVKSALWDNEFTPPSQPFSSIS